MTSSRPLKSLGIPSEIHDPDTDKVDFLVDTRYEAIYLLAQCIPDPKLALSLNYFSNGNSYSRRFIAKWIHENLPDEGMPEELAKELSLAGNPPRTFFVEIVSKIMPEIIAILRAKIENSMAA